MSKMSTYKAMITSLVCTFLCVALLCGMTYSWYLGTIDSGSNTIKIGAYDVSVKYADTPSSFTTVMSDGTVNFDVSGLGPGDFRVCYFQITNNSDKAATVRVFVTPVTSDADIQIYAASVTGAYTPDGAGTDYASLSATTAIAVSGGATVPARSGNTAGVKVIAVAVKLPENSVAANKTSTFTLKFDVARAT